MQENIYSQATRCPDDTISKEGNTEILDLRIQRGSSVFRYIVENLLRYCCFLSKNGHFCERQMLDAPKLRT